MPYYPPKAVSSSLQMQEFSSDPAHVTNDGWIRNSTSIAAGTPIGLLLSLTYATDQTFRQVSYYTASNTIIRMVIPNGG